MKLPLDGEERDRLRAAWLEEAILDTHRKMSKFMLSVRCQKRQHHRCMNDGIVCACRCHDQRMVTR